MSQVVTRSQGHKESWFKFNVALLVTWCLCVLVALSLSFAYALNLEKAKTYFLEGDYKTAILEGERILAGTTHTSGLDELYYILGLSYLKDGNYLRASDIFEIILKEFKESKFKEEAKLGLGDTYFLRGNYEQAEIKYKEIINVNPSTKLQPLVYYRIMQCALKRGDTQEAKAYLDRIKQKFPLSPEMLNNKELVSQRDIYYTVQVGSFSNRINAQKLTKELIQRDYPAYVEEAGTQDDKITYRVRVGKFSLRQEAIELENKLNLEGYPTKIYP